MLAVYFLSVLTAAMFISNPIMQCSALTGGILFCIVLEPPRNILKNMSFYVPMFLLVAISNPLFSHNGVTPLFFLNGNPVTLEAFAYGAALAVTVVGVMLWCRCYSEIMTSDKLLCLFGKTVPKLSLVLSMALRFIPMFKRQMKKVGKAQKAMGLYSSGSYVDKIRSALRVFSAMLSISLENSMDTAASMRARGYGLKGRTAFSLFRFSVADGVLLIICLLSIAVTLTGEATGATVLYYYPRISELEMSPGAVSVYVSFGILSLLPFIIEVKESLVWKYCVSKI